MRSVWATKEFGQPSGIRQPGLQGAKVRQDWQPIPGDMPPEEGVTFGGIVYYGDDFLQGKVAFMRSSPVRGPGQQGKESGLGLGNVHTWEDIKQVPRRELWGHCWIDERIADYRGARGPVWQRIAANDGLWVLFKQAEDMGLRHPSFKMIEVVLLNSGPDTLVAVEDIVPGLALAEELGSDTRNARDDAEIMQLVCDVATQHRTRGEEPTPDEIIATVRSIWTNPKVQSLRERAAL